MVLFRVLHYKGDIKDELVIGRDDFVRLVESDYVELTSVYLNLVKAAQIVIGILVLVNL